MILETLLTTNNLLFFVTVFGCFLFTVLSYKFFGKAGLVAWCSFAIILSNLECQKCVTFFGMEHLTLGKMIQGTTFLSTDILSEKYGGKAARKCVWVGFLISIAFSILTQIDLWYVPNQFDTAAPHLAAVFGSQFRIVAASLLAYLVSNILDTYSFDLLRKKFPNALWVRNNGSTMTSQLVDALVFTLVAFTGTALASDWKSLLITTACAYFIKVLVAALDTPFMYIAKRIEPISEI